MGQRRRGPRAALLTAEFFLLAAACLAAGWWQVTRALGGNGLSWFYSIEWPAFALIALWAWWHLLHEDPEAREARRRRPSEWDDPANDPYRTAAPADRTPPG